LLKEEEEEEGKKKKNLVWGNASETEFPSLHLHFLSLGVTKSLPEEELLQRSQILTVIHDFSSLSHSCSRVSKNGASLSHCCCPRVSKNGATARPKKSPGSEESGAWMPTLVTG
jgi:hypothetical protein